MYATKGKRDVNKAMDVIVGTPIYRQGAYIIDKFLANQKEIQQNYPSSELVLATAEDDFIEELERLLSFWGLRGKIIPYKTTKPAYARHRIWHTACGREALRQYALSQNGISYLLFLDADMTYDPSIIKIMYNEIQGYDVVFSGYVGHLGLTMLGVGCSMYTKSTLEKLRFRCYEFKNGDWLDEGDIVKMDLAKIRQRIKKGFFLSICHYRTENESRCISPQPMGLFQRVTNSSFVRYVLVRASIIVRRNIAWKLLLLRNRFFRPRDKAGIKKGNT